MKIFQLESFSLHLPNASFVSLLDIFKSLCSLSEHFFISSVDQIKNVAEIIDGMPLTLKVFSKNFSFFYKILKKIYGLLELCFLFFCHK